MTDKKNETGKAAPRPGDGPRRPYATIDLQAKEVGADRGQDRVQTGAAAAGGAKPDARNAALPPPAPKRQGGAQSALATGLRTVRTWSVKAAQNNSFLSHVAAGVAGAVLILAAGALFGLFADRGGRLSPEASKRFAAVEQTLDKRAGALAADVDAKLAAANARVAELEERARALGELANAQAKFAAQTKALEARVAAPVLTERIAKLESALAALSANDKSGRVALAEGLAAKLADIEKLADQAGEAAKSSTDRIDRDVAALKSQAAGLGQRVEALKADIEGRFKGVAKADELAPVLAKLGAFEQDLQAFLKTEGERVTNARHVLLALEIANLKRAMDRGDSYARELEEVRKVAGDGFSLAALERYSRDGVPTLAALGKDFRRFANAAIDAESEPADASVLDRLMAGARSIVRLRKAGHSPDDASVEAIVGRMEAALKDGHLGEVLAQAKRLPPRAAPAVEDWLRKVEARHSADRAVADIETALKSSFAARRPSATEPKR
jgi:uncharacterized protein YoxC